MRPTASATNTATIAINNTVLDEDNCAYVANIVTSK